MTPTKPLPYSNSETRYAVYLASIIADSEATPIQIDSAAKRMVTILDVYLGDTQKNRFERIPERLVDLIFDIAFYTYRHRPDRQESREELLKLCKYTSLAIDPVGTPAKGKISSFIGHHHGIAFIPE